MAVLEGTIDSGRWIYCVWGCWGRSLRVRVYEGVKGATRSMSGATRARGLSGSVLNAPRANLLCPGTEFVSAALELQASGVKVARFIHEDFETFCAPKG